MKLKILFFPVAVIAALVMIIWFIWPLYGEVRTRLATIEAKKQQVELLTARTKAVGDKAEELDRNAATRDFLFRYIPTVPDEEYVINAVSAIAQETGVGLVMMDIERATDRQKTFFMDPVADAAAAPVVDPAAAPMAPQVVKPSLREFSVDAAVVGSYESVKKFLTRLHMVDRLHGVATASIVLYKAPEQAAVEAPAVPTDAAAMPLLARVTAVFAYAPETVIPAGAVGEIFTRTMDLNKVREMQSRYAAAPALTASIGSVSNPFAPQQ